MSDIQKEIGDLLRLHTEALHEIGQLQATVVRKDSEIESLKKELDRRTP